MLVHTCSGTADVIIFIFIGMILVQTNHYWNTAFVLLTLAFCVLYRSLSKSVNERNETKKKISINSSSSTGLILIHNSFLFFSLLYAMSGVLSLTYVANRFTAATYVTLREQMLMVSVCIYVCVCLCVDAPLMVTTAFSVN